MKPTEPLGQFKDGALRLNLGCGSKKLPGWVNVDNVPTCKPDILWDLESFPWPWQDCAVSEVLLNHVLEHIGETRDVYLSFIRELYRVCRHDALIHIAVPHPRHDHFLWDPTHVRPIFPQSLEMFDQELNRYWQEHNMANTPMGIYCNVDFKCIKKEFVLDEKYIHRLKSGEMTLEEVQEQIDSCNNVCQQINIVLQVRKEEREREREREREMQ